ncbi:MAG: polysaccharide biosynthesis protein, partial [Longimicrobiales bacterium]
SDGSVVPLFKQQIAAGGPVTVTDPEVTRYFMTIPEAVQLVLQAAALPETSGRIAMLEMGRPMRILELAETLIRLSGFEPYTEMPIVFTGLRPGEKMHEELVSQLDAMTPTSVDKIWILSDPTSEGSHVRGWLERLDEILERGDTGGQLLALGELVPECVSPLRDRLALAARRRDPPSMLLPDERVLSRP